MSFALDILELGAIFNPTLMVRAFRKPSSLAMGAQFIVSAFRRATSTADPLQSTPDFDPQDRRIRRFLSSTTCSHVSWEKPSHYRTNSVRPRPRHRLPRCCFPRCTPSHLLFARYLMSMHNRSNFHCLRGFCFWRLIYQTSHCKA